LTRLDNAGGTGYLPDLLAMEESIFDETAEFLAGQPGSEELADFQERVANRVLEYLRSVEMENPP
jgi:hypothetical protein